MMKKNKLLALLLVASFLIAVPSYGERFWADSAEDKKKEAEEDLEEIEDEINDIEDEVEEVEEELETVRKRLTTLLEQQEELEAEIATTQADLEQTKIDLAIARAEADAQYEAMVIRIQYMYENGTRDSFWTALLEADGFADFLKRVEYISTIHEADRAMTDQYKEVVAVVEAKEQELIVKMDEMLMLQEAYLGQQAEIESMIAVLEDEYDAYAEELAEAEEKAEEYREIIKEQEEIIRKRDEEEKKKEEDDENEGNQDVSGETLVNYALQFVGNPYVWGGNSLTNGCDCSGFVHLVYKHFGYNTVRYSMSFAYEGRPVSYDEMKPGDVIVYERNSSGVGHVAIYIGNGKIVEAQSTKAGITSSRRADCRPIVAIRRILKNP